MLKNLFKKGFGGRKKMKKMLSIMALFVITLLSVSMVSAFFAVDSLKITSVEVNGDEVSLDPLRADELLVAVEEGQDLKVGIDFSTLTDVSVEVEAVVSGYDLSDREDLKDSTFEFFYAGTRNNHVDLELSLPKKLANDMYTLHLRVFDTEDGDSMVLYQDVTLKVVPANHDFEVVDVALSPGSNVKAGRFLYADVLLWNSGHQVEDDVKVTVAIPALGVSTTEFLDSVGIDDTVSVDEMALRIPETAAEGDYDVVVTVKYDNLEKSVTKTSTLHVLADKDFQTGENVLVLAVGPESQEVAAGKTAKYAVALTNAGATSKAFSLETVVGDWASASSSESLVVLEPGKNQIVYVDLAVSKDASAGEHLASLTVKSGSEVLETVVLKANVTESNNSLSNGVSLRNGLEIALVVLVVLLVLLGLIIGFSRLRKDDDGEEQTYY